MSNRALTWAYEQVLPSGAKFVLVTLADGASNDDFSCYPGQERLARMTGQGLRSVARHLQELEKRGLIVRERRNRKNGTRTSDRYVLQLGDATSPACPMSGDQATPVRADSNMPPWQVDPEGNLPNRSGQPATVAGEPSEEPNNIPPGANAPTPKGGADARADPRPSDDDGIRQTKLSEVSDHESKQGTRLAPDWRPDAQDRAYGRRKGFGDEEIDAHAERFRNHFVAGPGRRKTWIDWHRAWCNWLGRETPERRRCARQVDSGRDRRKSASVAAAARSLLDRD